MSSLSADESYLNHYRFSHDPFAARVPGFKFFPAQRKPVLGQLHHLARYSQLLLAVTGPEGSGKTLLRQALVASTNKQTVQSIAVVCPGVTDAQAVLQQVAQGLGIQRADADAIQAQIIQLALTGQEVYLLVDDAERLNEAALEVLLRLAAGSSEGRPHVFLFGEPDLVPRLEALTAGEERLHVIELQPYGEDETRDYLALRLEGADRGIEVLSREQIERIHDESGGWPGAINQSARDVLIEAMLASKGAGKAAGLSTRLPKKHLIAAAAVLCIVALVFLLQGKDKPQQLAGETTELQLGAAGGSPGQAQAGRGAAIEFDADRRSTPGPAQPVIREPLAAAAGAEADEQRETAGDEPNPGRLDVEPSPTPAAPTAPAEPARTPARPPVVTAPPAKPAKPAVAERPASNTGAAAASTSAASWYAAQPGTHYLIQVLGTSSEKSAQAVVREQGSNYRYFAKQHQGKPLYVVTYGNFANRPAAVAAIKNLPAPLQAGKPWVRTFSSVQQEIR